MTQVNSPVPHESVSLVLDETGQGSRNVRVFFRWLLRSILVFAGLALLYCAFASDRYVSEATVLIQNTEKLGMQAFDLSSIVGMGGGATRPDQLLLREHLISVDMLNKLDKSLDLRSHYSDSRRDFVSRMWFHDASLEWFYRHFLSRMTVTFDDFSGVLRVRAEAYEPQMAKDIVSMMVTEGERYMNMLSHQLAQAQVDFLDKQVVIAYADALAASQVLLNYQNKQGLASPAFTAESISGIIAKLEAQRTEIQTQLASLPRNLVRDHPNKVMLRQSLGAVEKQIAREKAKLASTSGTPLNSLVLEEQRLQMEVDFKKDVYKTALVALEQGRMDASRTLKQVSVLQTPMMPEYSMEPRRFYGALVILCLALLVLGVVKLLESVILDHVD